MSELLELLMNLHLFRKSKASAASKQESSKTYSQMNSKWARLWVNITACRLTKIRWIRILNSMRMMVPDEVVWLGLWYVRRGLFSYMNVENFFWEAGVFGCANAGEIGSLHSNLTKKFGIFDPSLKKISYTDLLLSGCRTLCQCMIQSSRVIVVCKSENFSVQFWHLRR